MRHPKHVDMPTASIAYPCIFEPSKRFPTFHSNHRLLGSAGYKYMPVPRAGYYATERAVQNVATSQAKRSS